MNLLCLSVLQICYSTLALSTDYDCWHEGEEDVTAEIVLQNIMKNVDMAKAIIKHAIPMIEGERGWRKSVRPWKYTIPSVYLSAKYFPYSR